MARWRQIVLGLVGLLGLVSACAAYGSVEETRLLALDSQTGRVQWSRAQLKRGHHVPQVAGDRIVVSQSNYESTALNFNLNPAVPQAEGNRCLDQGWGLTAYDTQSGQQRWVFCPNAQQFPDLDLKLTHGMRFQLMQEQVYVPLLMFDFPGEPQSSDYLLAIDAVTGALKWSIQQNFRQSLPFEKQLSFVNGEPQTNIRKVSSEGFGSSMVRVGRQVVVLTGPLDKPVMLQAFNAETGQLTWKQPLPDQFTAEFLSTRDPIVRNYLLANQRQVFQVSPIDGIIAVDAQTGAIQFKTSGQFWGRTVVTDTAFYQFEPDAVSAYDAMTGKQQWRREIPVPEETETYGLLGVVDHQAVYTRTQQLSKDNTQANIQVLSLNRSNGQQRWQKQFEIPTSVEIDVLPVISEGGVTLVVSNSTTPDQSDVHLVTLDAQTGEKRWTFPLNAIGDNKPIARIYGVISGDSDQIFVLNRASRFEHWWISQSFSLTNANK